MMSFEIAGTLCPELELYVRVSTGAQAGAGAGAGAGLKHQGSCQHSRPFLMTSGIPADKCTLVNDPHHRLTELDSLFMSCYVASCRLPLKRKGFDAPSAVDRI